MSTPVDTRHDGAVGIPCAVDGCPEVSVAGGACVAHLDESALAEWLAPLGDGGELDARGLSVDAPLLARIVAASSRRAGERRQVGLVRFEGAWFAPGIDFSGLVFGDPVSFDGARFGGDASFAHTTFAADARFGGVGFVGEAEFDGATFAGHAWFSEASFSRPASFAGARFADLAWFGGAEFLQDVSFDGARFAGRAVLGDAVFSGIVQLTRTVFAHASDRLDVLASPPPPLAAPADRPAEGSAPVRWPDPPAAASPPLPPIPPPVEPGSAWTPPPPAPSGWGDPGTASPEVAPALPQGPTSPAGGEGWDPPLAAPAAYGPPGSAPATVWSAAGILGPQPSAPDGLPARKSRVLRTVVAILLSVLTLGALGGGAYVIVQQRNRYPDRWDPRVADLVAFVERERGLEFKHPVEVAFLDDAAFRAEVSKAEAPTDEERAEAQSALAQLRAVGLVSGEVDLFAVGDELAGDGIAGFYTDDDERIVVRGSALDDDLRSTLVHELTHALQDQRFGLSGPDEKTATSGERTAWDAIVEADATAVADAWEASLSAAARQAMDEAAKQHAGSADFTGVPPVFLELMGFPYRFGPDFLEAVVAKDGEQGRNRLFTRPPTTEEHLLRPETFFAGQWARYVDVPALRAGEVAVEDSEGDIGMLSLLVMLAERIDFSVAWPAVQGWAGDAAVVFTRGGVTCVRAGVMFDEAAQADRFGAAIASWATGRPAATARLGSSSVEFESCDPGAAAAGGRAAGHVSGIQGLAMRQELMAGLAATGAPPDAATCIVDGVFAGLTADRIAQIDQVLTQNPKDPAAAEIQRTITRVAPGCR